MLKEVKIEVTNLCYRNCKHCSTDATYEEEKHRFLDKQKIKNIILEAHEMGATSIVLTGGEATLYSDLDEVISYAKKLGLNTKLYTFCYRTNENVSLLQNLHKAGLDEIIYSTATSLITSKELSTYNIAEFVNIIASTSNLKIGFHHVVTKDTIDDIKKLDKYIDASGNNFTKLSFLRYVPNHGRGTMELVPTDEQYGIFHMYLFNLFKKYGNKIRIGSPFNVLNLKNTPCNAADETMIVGYDGRVYPCDAMKYFDYLGFGGNINDYSLRAIYDSTYFKNIRVYKDMHGEKCMGCPNYKICRSGCLGQKMIYATSLSVGLTWHDYEVLAKRTKHDFGTRPRLLLNAEMGLFGEVGVLINDLKQLLTHDCDSKTQELIKQTLILKAGDIVWYLAASLSDYYDIAFEEMGNKAIGQKISPIKKIDNNLIKHCACSSDPACPYLTDENQKVSTLDEIITNNKNHFDIYKHWKQLGHASYSLSNTSDRSKIITLSSELLILISDLCNRFLGITLEQTLIYNILKLQYRYPQGYDVDLVSNKAKETATYKIKNANIKTLSNKK